MIYKGTLLGVIFIVQAARFSIETILPVMRQDNTFPVLALLSLSSLVAIGFIPVITKNLKGLQEKRFMLAGLAFSGAGVFIFGFSDYLGEVAFFVLLGFAAVIANIGSVGAFVPALVLFLKRNPEKAVSSFPVVEFFWDFGHSCGLVFPLFISDSKYNIYYFLPLTVVISVFVLVSFAKITQPPKTADSYEHYTLSHLLKSKAVLIDLAAIAYVLAGCKSIDPLVTSILEDLDTDTSLQSYFLISSSVASFVVSGILVFTLEYLDRKLLMLIGTILTTLGLLVVGPVTATFSQNQLFLRIGIIVLDIGMAIGTGTGFPNLYQSVKYSFHITPDGRVLELISGLYVFSIQLGMILGPSSTMWLMLALEYYQCFIILFAAGVVISVLYFFHYRQVLKLPKEEDLETTKLIE